MTTTTTDRKRDDDARTTSVRAWQLELTVAILGVFVGLAAVALFLN